MGRPLVIENKNFGLLWFGQLVSQLGDKIFSLAMMWYVLKLTDSSSYVSLVMVFTVLPVILFGTISGVIVDRISKKWVIVLSDLLRGILVLGTAYLVYLDNMPLWAIYVVVFSLGIFTAIFNPAISASVPLIVREDKLEKAMAYQSSLRDLSGIFGSAIGGWLIGFLGVIWSFVVNGVSFIISSILELPVKVPFERYDGDSHFIDDLKDGFRFVKRNRTIKHMLMLFMILNFFGPPIMIIIPVMVKRLSLDVVYLGYFEMSVAVGSVIGALLVASITPSKKKVLFMTFLFIGTGVLLGLIGFFTKALYLMIVMLTLGFMLAVVNINLMVIFQKNTPPEIKGRFFSILETGSSLIVPVGFLIAGWTVDIFGYSRNLYAMGLMIVTASIYFYFIPGINSIVEGEEKRDNVC